MLSITEWIPYLYLATIIIIVNKMAVIFITTFYDVKLRNELPIFVPLLKNRKRKKLHMAKRMWRMSVFRQLR